MSKNILPDDLPTKKRHVLISICVVIAICVISYLIDLKIVEMKADKNVTDVWKLHGSIASAILENLIAGVIAAVSLGLTFRWIIAFIDPRDRVIEISPSSITDRLRKNAQTARNYVFMGNTATFVSATILPILIDSALNKSYPRIVTLIMIDPVDASAVSSYSRFKNSVAQSQSKLCDQFIGKWVTPIYAPKIETPDEVIAKLISAIYIATFASLQKDMHVSIFLRRSFTPFRADMSDSEVVLTQESPTESAVAFASTGHFHGWYHKEAEAQQRQAIKIDLIAEQKGLQELNLVHPTEARLKVAQSIKAVLLHFPHLRKFANNQEIIELATDKVTKPSHSYG